MKKLPELLAPAGTPEALAAALDAGADAVYFGGTDFNARLRAANFTPDAMREAVKLCHAYGAKAYLTLNTLVTDRELPVMEGFRSKFGKPFKAGLRLLTPEKERVRLVAEKHSYAALLSAQERLSAAEKEIQFNANFAQCIELCLARILHQ